MSTLANAVRLSADPKLRRYVGVYLFLAEHLDPIEYRPVKLWYVAQCMHIDRHTVSRAVRALIHHGLLERGRVTGRGATYTHTFRLVATPVIGSGLAPNAPRQSAA